MVVTREAFTPRGEVAGGVASLGGMVRPLRRSGRRGLAHDGAPNQKVHGEHGRAAVAAAFIGGGSGDTGGVGTRWTSEGQLSLGAMAAED